MKTLRIAILATVLSGCPKPDPTCDGGVCSDSGVPVDAGGQDAGPDAGQPIACGDFVAPLELSVQPDGSFAAEATADVTSDHSAGRCVIGGGGGRDVAYELEVPAAGVLTVTATPEGARDVVLYLRAADCFASTDHACRDDGAADTAEALSIPVTAGRYVLFVDEYSGIGVGAVRVHVQLQPEAPPPGNDTCAAPLALAFIDGETTVEGDTTFATPEPPGNGGAPTCSFSAASAGRDLVYAFTVAPGELKDLSVTVTPHGLLRPIISVTSTDACAGSELACADSERLSLPELSEGTYFLWIDGRDGTSGPFTLRATLSDPPPPGGPDTCVGAVPVLISSTRESVTGQTRGAHDDVALPCAFGGGKDVFYAFSTTEPRRFRAVATPTSPASFRPALAVLPLTGCGSDGGVGLSGAAACARGGGGGERATLEVSELAAGDWLLVVDGVADTFGTFSLDLSLDPPAGPPANDTCANALPLSFTATPFGQRAQTTGSTLGGMNDHAASGACVGAGPDVAYVLPSLQGNDGGVVNVKASAWALNSLSAAPTLYLQTACDGSTLGCAGSGENGAAVNAWGVAPGTAPTVWVEGAPDAGGPFALEVDIATHAPANDTCASPITLPFSTTVAGNTLGATADYMGFGGIGAFYSGIGCAQSLAGAEVVYRFVTREAGVYTVRLQAGRTFDPGLVVTSACAPASCLKSVDVGLSGDEEQIQFEADAGTLYFVFVDSFSNDPARGTVRGAFGISVDPPAP